MKNDYFKKCVEKLDSHALGLLFGIKASTYAGVDDDRLCQFKNTARMRKKLNPVEALTGMANKHFSKMFDILDDLEDGLSIEEAQILETFGDVSNYLRLLYALAIDQELIKKGE